MALKQFKVEVTEEVIVELDDTKLNDEILIMMDLNRTNDADAQRPNEPIVRRNYKVNNEWLVKDLNEVQRSHLAWRLDHKTHCGLLTACKIARLETDQKNRNIYKLFMDFGITEKAAKIHACKVINFSLNTGSDTELAA